MPLPLAPFRQDKKLFPTPVVGDVLFYELRDCTRIDLPEYGTPHPNTSKWPDHKLVFIAEENDNGGREGIFRFFYAADRDKQDLYNWRFNTGEELVRDYIVPRDKYFARTQAQAEAVWPRVEGEFYSPEVATLDERFPQFGFADDTIVDAGEELRSLYIVVRRRFIEPVSREIAYDERLERNILITKRLIPAATGDAIPTTPTIQKGRSVEIQQGNIFHDVEITQEIVFNEGESFPIQLPDVPAYADFRFPARLDAVSLNYAWAYAETDDTMPSYSEDFYFKWDISEPRNGPYSATVKRFITDDPESIKALYPLTKLPQPRRETIGICYAWYTAGDKGAATQAVAREIEVPATIHGVVPVNLNGAGGRKGTSYVQTNSLNATPNFSSFMSKSQVTVSYEARRMPLGLYEVNVTILDISNLYS